MQWNTNDPFELTLGKFREGLTVEQLKQKIKDEAAKKLKAAQPKKVAPKVVAAETPKKASAATIAAKSQLPYDSSAPVRHVPSSHIYAALFIPSPFYRHWTSL